MRLRNGWISPSGLAVIAISRADLLTVFAGAICGKSTFPKEPVLSVAVAAAAATTIGEARAGGAMGTNSRMLELDLLRGFAVAVMILVVSPGAWEFSYPQLQHADWHGWTLGDLVFPDFLFGVGMAVGLTVGRSLGQESSERRFWSKTGRRVIALILLGLLLNYLAVIGARLGAAPVGPEEIPELRIPGVLQRIALCYLVAVAILYATGRRDEAGAWKANVPAIGLIILAILIGYWILLTRVPVPGFGPGDLGKAGNLPAYLDRAIFTTPHMWRLGAESWRGPVVYDPEGLLSSLPATANVLFGVLAAALWRDLPNRRLPLLLVAGVTLIAVALLLDRFFPINKKLWTSTFVLLTSGISCLALLLVGLLASRRALRKILRPLEVLGGNALLAFSISIFLSMLISIPFGTGEGAKTLQRRGFLAESLLFTDPYLASFAFALVVLAFILLLIWPLHRRGMHLRV